MLVKHIPYSTRRLRDAYMYLAFAHAKRMVGDRRYYDLVTDADGIPLQRPQCDITYVDASGEECDAYLWSSDCVTELMRYGGDQDVITHSYIISWPPYDWIKVSLDDLIDIGIRIAREFFVGHHVLVAAHMDKEHPHIHLCAQNLRAADRDSKPWMLTGVDGSVLPCEVQAGGKHHHTPAFEDAMHAYGLELSRAYGLDDTDFRKVVDKRRKNEVDERRKKIKETLAKIRCEYRCGMDISKLAYLMELYCGARIIAGNDGKLRIGFGRRGKTYSLDAWGLTPVDIYTVLLPAKHAHIGGGTDWQAQRIMDGLAIAHEEGVTDYTEALGAADLSAAEMRFFSDRRSECIEAMDNLRPYVVAVRRYLRLDEQIRRRMAHGVGDDDDALIALIADRDALGTKLNVGNSDIYGMLADYEWMRQEVESCDRRLSRERERHRKLRNLREETLTSGYNAEMEFCR